MLTATLVISNAKYGTRRARLRGKAGVRSRSGQLGDCAACAKLVPSAATHLKEPRWGRWMGRSIGRARAGRSRRACWGSFGLRAALSVVLLMTWNYSASFAEDATKVVRIGVLASAQEHPIQSFKERLRELGWIEGKNVQFDYRWAEAMTLANPR